MRILLVVSSTTNPTPGEAALRDRLAVSHTVTLQGHASPRPGNLAAAYDLVVFSGSVSAVSLDAAWGGAGTPIPALAVGYASFLLLGLTSGQGGASTGTTGYILDASHPITSGLTAGVDLTLYTSSGARNRAGTGTVPASGLRLVSLSAANSGLAVVVAYEAGVTLADGSTAPARRAICGLADVHLATSAALGILDRAVAWVLGAGSGPPAPPTSVSATARSATRVEISHVDASTTETYWRYYAAPDLAGSPDTGSAVLLEEVATTTGAPTGGTVVREFVVPAASTRWYGVAARGSGGTSGIAWAPSAVTTPALPPVLISSPGPGAVVPAGTLVGLAITGPVYTGIAWYRGDPDAGGVLLGTASGILYDTTGRPNGVEVLYARVTPEGGGTVTVSRPLTIGAASGGGWDAGAYAIRALGGII